MMGSNDQQSNQHTVNINTTIPSTSPPTSHIDHRTIEVVDKLELESYKRKCRQLELALISKQDKENREFLTEKEEAEITRTIDATEAAARVPTRLVTITHVAGDTETVSLSELPNSYQQIKNLVWIENQPIYKTALAEWKSKVVWFEARVERKIKQSAALNNEIYNLIGFYSVFQGVLLTSTSQSNYLHCQNVGLVISLSALASVCCLLGIYKKINRIYALEKNICSEESSLKEARQRISSLKRNGEAFRFYDFLEDKETSSHCPCNKFKVCGFKIRCLVPLMIFLFSIVFVMAHPLILCRPGYRIQN